ncbi:hypothetical protein ASPZODRAFT_18063 [Penicilliopsis zonata CBS 506.65]|uniref:F-box domain-containing protein n=1 Tax=Penicilliopsis zonata CBS 506.65 TaxID=1073090 RepID=A0A1L9SDJ3_9EURO|nr:hypothetical protein ASPZODRAFT_18063 [Penicilliopsis zonata CBS 506.65]OJJ45157.1 hypothetical protein ASPZODRAFT_18063 [Penicilliopsis zonata CBS 506.65]
MESLSEEVFMIILEYSDQRTQAALSQTCRAFHRITLPFLYKSVCIQASKCDFENVLPTIGKYSNLIHSLAIDTNRSNLSPCRVAPYLNATAKLQALALYGGYWMWDGEDERWATLEADLYGFFTLQTGIQSNLRSLTLDRVEKNGQAAFLQSPVVFQITTLQKLTLRGFLLDASSTAIEARLHRSTDLTILVIERSYLAFPALRNILHAPRALRRLTVSHDRSYGSHELGFVDQHEARLAELIDVLLLHRNSLEELNFAEEDMIYNEEAPFGYSWQKGSQRDSIYADLSIIEDDRNGDTDDEDDEDEDEEDEDEEDEDDGDDFKVYAKQFPSLRHWDCDVDGLRIYLNDPEY